MITRNIIKNRILLFLILSLSVGACLDLQEIPFIDFKADFQVPSIVRVGDEIEFVPSLSTDQSTRFFWQFGDLDSTTNANRRPSFSYDTIGTYVAKLRVEIQKSVGLLIDSTEKQIRVLPQLASLDTTSISSFDTISIGELNSDEIGLAFTRLPDSSGYALLGKKDINTLTLIMVDNNLNITSSQEISNISSGQVFGQDITTTSDGGFAIVGYIQSRANENDAFILRLEADGQIGDTGWLEIVPSIKNELYNSVVEVIGEQDTNFVAVGTVVNSGRPTLLVNRYSSSGELLDSKTFDTETECQNCRGNRAILTEENGFDKLIIAGTDIDNPALFRIGFNGKSAVFESRSVLRNFQGRGLTVRLISDGKFILAGEIGTGRSDSVHAFVTKFDVIRQGATPTWDTPVILYQESITDIFEDSQTNLIAVGTHFSPLSQKDIIITKLNSLSGALLDVRLIGNGQNNQARRLYIDSSDQILLIGSTETNSQFNLRDLDFIALPSSFLN